MQQTILDKNYSKPGHRAWAFGLGLERLAMVLFSVPDIRLFWWEGWGVMQHDLMARLCLTSLHICDILAHCLLACGGSDPMHPRAPIPCTL
jgi:hypothetical protein